MTGKPKCIVHGQVGTLLQHKKEHQLAAPQSFSQRCAVLFHHLQLDDVELGGELTGEPLNYRAL